MRAKLVKIGNSRGIRLPKPVIEQVGLEGEVELEVREGEVVISPARAPRSGWEEAARTLAARGEDRVLDEPIATAFDDEEWSW
jgi:antitoxin MazE